MHDINLAIHYNPESKQEIISKYKGKYADYLRSSDSVLTKLAGEIANQGIAYCSTQISKILPPIYSKKVTDSLADASEVVSFIPGMVGSRG